MPYVLVNVGITAEYGRSLFRWGHREARFLIDPTGGWLEEGSYGSRRTNGPVPAGADETLALTRDRIDWRAGKVVRLVSKSRRWRCTDVVPAVLRAWKALPERPDGRLFWYADRHAVYRTIDGLGLGLHVRPHMARRGPATALEDEGADLNDIMRAVGWEDSKSARPSVCDDPAPAKATLGKIRGRIRGGAVGRRKAGRSSH